MMQDLIIHPQTEVQLKAFMASPVHAVLLAGPTGIGKRTIAQTLISQLLGIAPDKLPAHPYFTLVEPDEKGTISIEAVRTVQKRLQLKTTGNAPLRRAILVENAQCLTTEAQNALLKLLEEPPADTIFVLTTPSARALLPTIRSRAQLIPVHTPETAMLTEYFERSGKDPQVVTQARFLSGGLPGLMYALLGDEEHPLISSVRTAKELLQKNTFERLAMVDALSRQKTETINLLDALLRISLSAQNQAADKQDVARLRQWHTIRTEVVNAQRALAQSGNTKLTLTKMLLHM